MKFEISRFFMQKNLNIKMKYKQNRLLLHFAKQSKIEYTNVNRGDMESYHNVKNIRDLKFVFFRASV
jgi:hypothetical protein